MDRVVPLSAFFVGRDRDQWGRDAVDGGYARTSRVLSNREDICGTVVQPVPFFQGEGDGVESTVRESNVARTPMPVAFLVPVDKDITGLEYSIRGNDGFRRILTVVARLIVNGAVIQSQWEEAFLRASSLQRK